MFVVKIQCFLMKSCFLGNRIHPTSVSQRTLFFIILSPSGKWCFIVKPNHFPYSHVHVMAFVGCRRLVRKFGEGRCSVARNHKTALLWQQLLDFRVSVGVQTHYLWRISIYSPTLLHRECFLNLVTYRNSLHLLHVILGITF